MFQLRFWFDINIRIGRLKWLHSTIIIFRLVDRELDKVYFNIFTIELDLEANFFSLFLLLFILTTHN